MPRFAANLSMLYFEHAFLDRFGCDGCIGCEYRPRDAWPGGTTAGLGWIQPWRL